MDDILEILSKDARRTPQEIAKLTSKSAEKVKKAIKEYEDSGVILQYKTVINKDLLENGKNSVRALIEVGIMPQKDLGFDSIAERIFNFPEVKSCYLVSGGYDLLVVVEGDSIQMVAEFVASKLSPMPNVRQTATHFLLKTYKEDGQIFKKSIKHKRLNISP